MELGPLENRIMEIVWRKRKVDAREIYKELNREKKLAYTTINTTLTRLCEKNLLKRKAIKGRGGMRYIYTPTKTKRKFQNFVIRKTLDDLLSRFGEVTIQYFSENLNLSEEEIEMLKRRMEELNERGD
ncbi:MAG: BlaI/MecI/CopY family transcriptional regulator [Candidatus Methanofastidiosia archaeon]